MVRTPGQHVAIMAYAFLTAWPMLYSALTSKYTAENLTKSKNSHLCKVSKRLLHRSGMNFTLNFLFLKDAHSNIFGS